MTLALILSAVVISAMNARVSILVLRNSEYGSLQKTGQVVLVWILPIVGAIITFYILREAHDTGRTSDGPFVESGKGNYPLSGNVVEGFSGGDDKAGGDGH